MDEKILSTRTIFDGRIVHLKVHQVELPDGNHSEREIIYHQGAVAIIALDDAQNVLMVRQFRLGAGQQTLEIPAGILESGEDPQAAVIRELQEETGYRPRTVTALGGLHVAPGYTTEYIHLFYAIGLIYDPLEQDADEFVEAVSMPLTDALARVESGEITEAKTIIGLLRVARHLGI